jgi:hypothetical protein
MTAEARPEDLRLTLGWQLDADGALRGELVAGNVSDHPVRLSGKPALQVLGEDGSPLSAQTVVTLEFRPPGYVELDPGQHATAPVSWAGWDGSPAGDVVVVELPGGSTEVRVSGPRQPTARGPATNLGSSWFQVAD